MFRKKQSNKPARTTPKQKVYYDYGPFALELTDDHKLPEFQRDYQNFDKFLPIVAEVLDPNDRVIDVGANVGDTVAAMACRNPDLQFLCVDADPVYYAILQSNIKIIQNAFPNLRVETHNQFVSSVYDNVKMLTGGGTGRILPDETGDIRTTTLDHVLSRAGRGRPFKLLKTDVDGYDFDVINAAPDLLSRDEPMLFFECEFWDEQCYRGYVELMPLLANKGYNDWALFDNFGGLVLQTDRLDDVLQLLQYVWRQDQSKSTRTFYHFDIFMTTTRNKDAFSAALNAYRAIIDG